MKLNGAPSTFCLVAGNTLRWAVAGYVALCFFAALYFALFHATSGFRVAALFAVATAAGLAFWNNVRCHTKWLVLPLIIGILLRCVMFFIPNEQVSDFKIFEELATALKQGDGFAYTGKTGLAMDVGLFINNPTATPPVVTAFRLPGYPLLLAFTLRIVNNPLVAAKLLNCLLQVVIAMVLYRIGCIWNRQGALRVLWLWAIYPASIVLTALSCSELAFTAVLGLLALFLETVWVSGQGNTTIKTLLFGCLCGCLVMIRPATQLLVCGVVVVVAAGGAWQKTFIRVLVYVLGVALPLSLWGARNLQEFGRFEVQTTEIGLGWYTLTREYLAEGVDARTDSLTHEMRLSSDEFERADLGKKIGIARLKKAVMNRSLLGRMGQNHLKVWRTDDETGWILQGLSRGHAARTFLSVVQIVNEYWYLLILCCGLCGAFTVAKNRQRITAGMLFLSTGLLGTGALFLLFEGQPRYHIPFMVLILLLSGRGNAKRTSDPFLLQTSD